MAGMSDEEMDALMARSSQRLAERQEVDDLEWARLREKIAEATRQERREVMAAMEARREALRQRYSR